MHTQAAAYTGETTQALNKGRLSYTAFFYWFGYFSYWNLLTCLHIQSGFSQPKLSSRTLHPHGQKCTRGPSMGWFWRGNNVLLVLDLSHPWGKAKGINTMASRLSYCVPGLRALPREVMQSTNPNNQLLCTLLWDPRSTHSATLTSLLLRSRRCFVSNTYTQRLFRNTSILMVKHYLLILSPGLSTKPTHSVLCSPSS